MIMHSHGWGGSRTTDPATFATFLDAGYGVLSFDQRGFGESGGHAHVENPDVEGHDVRAPGRRSSASLRWVQAGRPRRPAARRDRRQLRRRLPVPRRLRGAARRAASRSSTRSPRRSPGTTSAQSLAPERRRPHRVGARAERRRAAVRRAARPTVYKALVEGAATGSWPDGSIPATENLAGVLREERPGAGTSRHGRKPRHPGAVRPGHHRLAVQRSSRAWPTGSTAITPRARRQSIFVGYNGGHVLPAVLPQGVNVTSDPCSKRLAGGDFRRCSIRFFDEQLKGKRHRPRRATAGSTSPRPGSTLHDRRLRRRPTKPFALGTVATTDRRRRPARLRDRRRARSRWPGSPYLTGDGHRARRREPRSSTGSRSAPAPPTPSWCRTTCCRCDELDAGHRRRRRIALPAVAVDVPAGRSCSCSRPPISDTFVGMAAATPGVVLLDDTVVHLPVVRR